MDHDFSSLEIQKATKPFKWDRYAAKGGMFLCFLDYPIYEITYIQTSIQTETPDGCVKCVVRFSEHY